MRAVPLQGICMSDLAKDMPSSRLTADVRPARHGSGAPGDVPARFPAGAQHGPQQSGLDYFWHDGAPVLPQMTSGRRVQLFAKRGVDIVGALLAILMLSPLLLGLWAAIRLTSRGPAVFTQMRAGRDGKPFRIYKFRSMYTELGDASGVTQTVADDPRVTPVGRFIRRSNLDELPQLFNVLLGDMSLVGPRPHPIGMLAGGKVYEELVPYYALRHAMRPGITGWAQARGLRGPTTDAGRAKARVDHDLAYIQNFSLWLDLRVILLTLATEIVAASGG